MFNLLYYQEAGKIRLGVNGKMPKVSVLFPVYNTNEAYLRAAVESVLNQTFKDFEFLIVNDASTDRNVEKVVRSYDDDRISYIANDQNLGIAKTRNKMMDLARGEYFAVVDHDDVSMPDRFEKQVCFLDTNPDVGVVGCQYEKLPSGKISMNVIYDKDIKLALFRSCAITHPGAMIRKSVITDHNIRYEEKFSPAEDYALWCRLSRYTKFHNLPDVLLHYREHAGNASKMYSREMAEATLAVHTFMPAENPAMYNLFLLKATHTTRYKLFGLVPFLTVIKKGYCTKVLLFEKIPLLSFKQNIKLKED